MEIANGARGTSRVRIYENRNDTTSPSRRLNTASRVSEAFEVAPNPHYTLKIPPNEKIKSNLGQRHN
jgi:hypothetical protein